MTFESSGYFLQSSSPLDSALFFVLAAFILNVIVVIGEQVLMKLAFCYFDPSAEPPLINRTYHTLRRISRSRLSLHMRQSIKEDDDPQATVLFV
uniref:Ion_trans domain-containing protein n=1 Tax=Heterorhabditis bacteriophora TaxID=37862 RepID=A0A1I7WSD7_HETBA